MNLITIKMAPIKMNKSVDSKISCVEKLINDQPAWVEKLWNFPLYHLMQFVVFLCFVGNIWAAYNIFTHNDELDLIAYQFSILALTFLCLALINVTFYSLLASKASQLFNSVKFTKAFNLTGGLCLICAGLYTATVKKN
ncbi:hypothetical protein [Vibrio xiamenensis]|nr:hypothetical protein [Vibrio xiamenensis]